MTARPYDGVHQGGWHHSSACQLISPNHIPHTRGGSTRVAENDDNHIYPEAQKAQPVFILRCSGRFATYIIFRSVRHMYAMDIKQVASSPCYAIWQNLLHHAPKDTVVTYVRAYRFHAQMNIYLSDQLASDCLSLIAKVQEIMCSVLPKSSQILQLRHVLGRERSMPQHIGSHRCRTAANGVFFRFHHCRTRCKPELLPYQFISPRQRSPAQYSRCTCTCSMMRFCISREYHSWFILLKFNYQYTSYIPLRYKTN